MAEYRKFVTEKEIVDSYKVKGVPIPPWIVFQPYVVRNGIPGYMVVCKPDDPQAELWNRDTTGNENE